MTVILPQDTGAAQVGIASASGGVPQAGYPTLWLLHGLSDDHTIWMRRTSIERYVADTGLAVVMPQVDRSYYADMVQGKKYWTFISEELPKVARQFFRLSERREDNFVAGLSMGGYGAFKLALNHPERYAAAASLSGALDPIAFSREASAERQEEWGRIFGNPPQTAGDASDLFAMAMQMAAGPHAKMPLYQCCGKDDFIYENGLTFRNHALELGLNVTYEEHAGESHEWGYWDRMIQRVLEWLPVGDVAMASKNV